MSTYRKIRKALALPTPTEGGDIEHHLGLTGPKDISTWVSFRRRLANEPFKDRVSDHETAAGLAHWPQSGEAPV